MSTDQILAITRVRNVQDQKSFEICGAGYNSYTIWAFSDSLHDNEPLAETDEKTFPYEDFDYRYVTIHEDPFAWLKSLDANIPIMDARTYAVRLLSSHVDMIVKH